MSGVAVCLLVGDLLNESLWSLPRIAAADSSEDAGVQALDLLIDHVLHAAQVDMTGVHLV